MKAYTYKYYEHIDLVCVDRFMHSIYGTTEMFHFQTFTSWREICTYHVNHFIEILIAHHTNISFTVQAYMYILCIICAYEWMAKESRPMSESIIYIERVLFIIIFLFCIKIPFVYTRTVLFFFFFSSSFFVFFFLIYIYFYFVRVFMHASLHSIITIILPCSV